MSRPGPVHHADRGCTYTCEDYQTYLAAHGITCSMSRQADGSDNAVMEAFFSTVKREEAECFPSYGDAKMALFDYIEVFYNTATATVSFIKSFNDMDGIEAYLVNIDISELQAIL